jgi:uncharacterized protein (DUF58 family)
MLPLGRERLVIDVHKDTQFSDAWIILAVLLLVAGIVFDSRYLTAIAWLLLLTTGITWLWSRFSLTGLTYTRRFSEHRAFLGETVQLTLEVSNRKILPLTWLTIRDLFPAELPVAGTELEINRSTNLAEFSTFWMVGPYQRVTRRFDVTCTVRGFHRYGPARVLTGDGFGFFNRGGTLSSAQDLIVYPRLYSVDELRLPTHNPFGDVRVQGSLFEDPLRTAGIRQWRSSDGLRRVHWKATARQQELVSRIYEPSEEHVIQLFLNVATLERHWHGHIPELHERAISVAGSLALLATEQRRPVGLVANGALPGSDQPIKMMPGRSPNQLVRLLELLAAVTPFATKPIGQLLADESVHLPRGATLVLVTAIAGDDLLASLSALSEAGRRVVLFTLAEKPPHRWTGKVSTYHLPHLVDDIISPVEIRTDGFPK